ncbi:MAG: di-trans,poly-cis-decaprenylcistransferase [Clostridia bacterium]|nr:di-trans,poly-cis-decaprenylcistransferase [Clostridia bacterium]
MSEKKLPITDSRLDSVAIIMDGNGRWAKARGLARSAGHIAGAKIVQGVLETFKRLDIHHVTLYAFSTENWKRPKDEVDTLMGLLYDYVDRVVIKMLREDDSFSVKFIGDRSVLPDKLRAKLDEAEEMSKNKLFTCYVALNYGGRDEIVAAANSAIRDGYTELNKDIMSRYMYTYPAPDPDMVIRTGGDFRISNFLLWQSAYAEYMILDTLWPDFSESDIVRCVEEFYSRDRRFGGLSANDKK